MAPGVEGWPSFQLFSLGKDKKDNPGRREGPCLEAPHHPSGRGTMEAGRPHGRREAVRVNSCSSKVASLSSTAHKKAKYMRDSNTDWSTTAIWLTGLMKIATARHHIRRLTTTVQRRIPQHNKPNPGPRGSRPRWTPLLSSRPAKLGEPGFAGLLLVGCFDIRSKTGRPPGVYEPSVQTKCCLFGFGSIKALRASFRRVVGQDWAGSLQPNQRGPRLKPTSARGNLRPLLDEGQARLLLLPPFLLAFDEATAS